MNEPDGKSIPPGRPVYVWPRYVLAGVILGVILAILWMSHEVSRLRRYRQMNSSGPPTNQSLP